MIKEDSIWISHKKNNYHTYVFLYPSLGRFINLHLINNQTQTYQAQVGWLHVIDDITCKICLDSSTVWKEENYRLHNDTLEWSNEVDSFDMVLTDKEQLPEGIEHLIKEAHEKLNRIEKPKHERL